MTRKHVANRANSSQTPQDGRLMHHPSSHITRPALLLQVLITEKKGRMGEVKSDDENDERGMAGDVDIESKA